MTERQHLKIVLLVSGRKHRPPTLAQAITFWEQVIDSRDSQFSELLTRMETSRNGFRRLYSEVWNLLQQEQLEEKSILAWRLQ